MLPPGFVPDKSVIINEKQSKSNDDEESDDDEGPVSNL